MIKHAQDTGCQEIEVTKAAESAWLELLANAPPMMIGSTDCTPGYYNNEGKGWTDEDAPVRANGYPAGSLAYFKYLQQWRASGEFAGVEFR